MYFHKHYHMIRSQSQTLVITQLSKKPHSYMVTQTPPQVHMYNGSFDLQLKQNKHTQLQTKLHN